jgi:uncharacterized protein (TIGR03435 family)
MTMRALAGATLLTLLCSPLFAQSPAAPTAAPAFDIANVHASPYRFHPAIRFSVHGDRLLIRDATLVDLIADTYAVDPSSVFGGPQWLAFDHFDIFAKLPTAASKASAMPMLRPLLDDRFKLVAHTGTRPLPAFVLSAGSSPKLKKSADSAEHGGCQYQQPAKDAPPSTTMKVNFSCHNTSMQTFVDFLQQVASPYLNRPVVDSTGLKGGYDFDIQWTYRIPKDADGVTIFQAVDKQLGLKLELKTTPLPVVDVVSVIEQPTPNVADIDKLLPPPPPAEFDVAVIRPSNPDETRFGMNIQGNTVNIQYATLLTLIYNSYNIAPGKIENKPKWLDDQHYDILGKASTGDVSPIPGMGSSVDIDDVWEMTRSLLADRFKLATHTDLHPSDVYALLTANPKMKKADPSNHPSCHEGPGPDGKDPRIDTPLRSRLISCQNMTMSQLTTELSSLASGYLPAPVIDATGLDGAYDFTLSFSKQVDLNKPLPTPSNGDASAAASDPSLGAISLFDAMQKQLGLKLQKRDKVPMPTLVIDHIEQKPTEN